MAVYLTQEPPFGKFDLSDVERFSTDVRTVLPFGKSHLFNTAQAVKIVQGRLALFTPDDYLLPIGDPVAIALSAAIAAQRTGGRVSMLLWDNHDRKYYKVSFNV